MAGLSLSLLAVVAGVAWLATRPDTYVAPRPEPTGPRVAPEAAAAALEDLTTAVQERDSDAAGALAAADDAASSSQLVALAVNAGLLHVEDFGLRYVDEASGISPDGTWTAAVDATWAFGGFDDAPARAEVLMTFRVNSAETGEARIVSIGGGDRRTPVWMGGPVTVRRTPSTLVVVAGDSARLADYQRVTEAAIPPVTRVLRSWRPRLVVEVPADLAGLEAALDADAGAYASIAAVTASPDGMLTPDAPLHVFVNPEVFDRNSEQGDRVVMSHEAAHVATRAPESTAPKWLIEGFADYIALRGIDLPVSRIAAQIIDQVRRQGVPRALPDQDDFNGGEAHLGAAYEAAWLVCEVLAERGGEDALVRFYEEADAGGPLAGHLQAGFGWSEGDLVAAWQQRLRELAR
ncbi:MAG: hypothetical protein M3237_18750 [Actinomycetota bacterium]|nr:hypothetical protein [Actinomycetota bacterium]